MFWNGTLTTPPAVLENQHHPFQCSSKPNADRVQHCVHVWPQVDTSALQSFNNTGCNQGVPAAEAAAGLLCYRPRIAFLNSAECCCLQPPPPRPRPPRPPVLYSMYTCRRRQTRPVSDTLMSQRPCQRVVHMNVCTLQGAMETVC
jgi:hypothetical protein